MKTNKRFTIVVVLILCCYAAMAQPYSRAEQTVLQPLQVLTENFTMIPVAGESAVDVVTNHFDKFNPYTYLQLIRDNEDKNYQVLFQTNFAGRILFLALNNSLAAQFNNPNKPLNVFVMCIRQINNHLSAVQNADAAVSCIIERLNYVANQAL